MCQESNWQLVIADTLLRNPLSVQSSDTEEDVQAFTDAADIASEDGRDQLWYFV